MEREAAVIEGILLGPQHPRIAALASINMVYLGRFETLDLWHHTIVNQVDACSAFGWIPLRKNQHWVAEAQARWEWYRDRS